MDYVKPVRVLIPAKKGFKELYPYCCNSISVDTDTAYLVCPFDTGDPSLIKVNLETTKYRKYLIRLFEGGDGLYATPYFAESAFGAWEPGGAYILLPVWWGNGYACGYDFRIQTVAIPLYDHWARVEEPKEVDWSIFKDFI